jgi:hypothetical protein
VLKIFNLSDSNLQIRSKQRISGASTKQCGTRFELSEFQPGTIKQVSNMGMHEPQICIVNHDHITVITWFVTHINVRGSKRSNFRRNTFHLKIQLFILTKTLQSNLSWLQRAFSSSVTYKERPSGDESSLTSESESEMCREALPMRQRPVKSHVLRLRFSSSSELEESSLEKLRSLRAAHAQDIIFWNFFFFLSPKWYFFLPSPLSLESFRLL